ncbi:MAG: hypothetical protein WBP38_06840 [Hyphomicrobium sp.]|jgi:hypothetical protein|nr:hypothetical protein [Hyphomicrobium sp.]
MARRRLAAVAVLVAALGGPAFAVGTGWDHKANIEDAAKRLVKLHKREGSTGVLKFLDACYRTHLLSSTFTAGLESCMAQDLMHTQLLALIYSRLPPERLKKLGAPSPEAIAKSMNERFVTSFMQYKVTVTEGDEFKRQVNEYGVPIFVKGVFPKSSGAQQGAPSNTGK